MSISKVNIQEANSHLRKLHKKVFELENRIQMQAMHVEELQKANRQLQHQLSQGEKVVGERDETIAELSQRLEEAESHVQQLLEAAQERDTAVLQMEKKSRLFYEVVEHRASIARILEVLEELSVNEPGGQDSLGDSFSVEEPGTKTTPPEAMQGQGEESTGSGSAVLKPPQGDSGPIQDTPPQDSIGSLQGGNEPPQGSDDLPQGSSGSPQGNGGLALGGEGNSENGSDAQVKPTCVNS